MSGLHFEDYAVGQRFTSDGRTVTDADIRLYLGATGTAHPNHTDEEYCKRHPILKGICAPGVLVLGLVDAFIADAVTRHMGGVRPRPTLTAGVCSEPSGCFVAPKMMTAAPGLISLLSPAA